MPKHFLCCLSLRTGAFIMTGVNLLGGSAEVIMGAVKLHFSHDEGDTVLFVNCILIGLVTLFNGIILALAILQANERYVLLYLLTGSVDLMILTIYSGMNMFLFKWLTLVFVLSNFKWSNNPNCDDYNNSCHCMGPSLSSICLGHCSGSVVLWYCQYCIYSFYEEVLEYNTVKAGAIEISYNDKGYTNSYLQESELENTPV